MATRLPVTTPRNPIVGALEETASEFSRLGEKKLAHTLASFKPLTEEQIQARDDRDQAQLVGGLKTLATGALTGIPEMMNFLGALGSSRLAGKILQRTRAREQTGQSAVGAMFSAISDEMDRMPLQEFYNELWESRRKEMTAAGITTPGQLLLEIGSPDLKDVGKVSLALGKGLPGVQQAVMFAWKGAEKPWTQTGGRLTTKVGGGPRGAMMGLGAYSAQEELVGMSYAHPSPGYSEALHSLLGMVYESGGKYGDAARISNAVRGYSIEELLLRKAADTGPAGLRLWLREPSIWDEVAQTMRRPSADEVARGERVIRDIEKLPETHVLYGLVHDANPEDLLDLDLPMSEQSEKVRAAMGSVMEKIRKRLPARMLGEEEGGRAGAWERAAGEGPGGSLPRSFEAWTGYEVHQYLSRTLKKLELQKQVKRAWHMGQKAKDPSTYDRHMGDRLANDMLVEAGIPGSWFLDQFSRFGTPGALEKRSSRNIIMFTGELSYVNPLETHGSLVEGMELGIPGRGQWKSDPNFDLHDPLTHPQRQPKP